MPHPCHLDGPLVLQLNELPNVPFSQHRCVPLVVPSSLHRVRFQPSPNHPLVKRGRSIRWRCSRVVVVVVMAAAAAANVAADIIIITITITVIIHH